MKTYILNLKNLISNQVMYLLSLAENLFLVLLFLEPLLSLGSSICILWSADEEANEMKEKTDSKRDFLIKY